MPTSTKFPGTAANVDRAGNTAWSSPGNVSADDATTSDAAVPTDYLVASNFAFDIPAGAKITGISVVVEAHETGSGTSNYILQLISDTTPTLIGSTKTQTVSGATPAAVGSGGGNDRWGAPLNAALVNSAAFGVVLYSDDTVNTLFVDYIQMVITYVGNHLAAQGVG